METKLIKNNTGGEFVIEIDNKRAGELAFINSGDDTISAVHTLVFDEYRDLKLGGVLFQALVDYLKNENLKLIPVCPYIVKMMQKHPEYSELLSPQYHNSQN